MINLPQWTGGTDEEYETQHFGFGAQRLKIAVRQMIGEKIRTGIKDMESYLQESLDLNETDKITLTRSFEKLIHLYSQRSGPSLKIIDGEIERMLIIPHNVLLPSDEVQLDQISDDDYNKLKDEVSSLRKRVERAALMEALLAAEDEELTSVEAVCEVAKKDMEVLDSLQKKTEDANSLKLIQNEVQFLCASAPFTSESDELGLFDPDKSL